MSTKKIAIIGAGVAGLTLAYAFQSSRQFDFTIMMTKDSEEIRNGRILSTQIHFGNLLENEKRFGVPDYGAVNEINRIELLINGQRLFQGNLACRAVSQDQRLYLSVLIDDLKARGADIRKVRLDDNDLSKLANEYDLIIDCTGKRGPLASFPKYEELLYTPTSPQRIITAGMFLGIAIEDEHKMSFNIVPGQGELFETTTMTLLLEAVPGSNLDAVIGSTNPDIFNKEMLGILKANFPHIYDRVSLHDFRPVDPLAYTRMAIQPEVFIPYTMMDGTLVLGCGDSVVLNDPVTGQGANTASFCANVLYHVLSDNANRKWDLEIGEHYWDLTKEYVTKVSDWTNAMMGPPSENFAGLIGKASHNQEMADKFVNLFTNPLKAYNAFFGVS
ncbi:hypothetical protein ASG89_28030 [Paenibacillus sp. Soil766]|uniref:styrene monooxygenase/indole monooxygenase family protein n=1 Tax=Paenibacillus sp. Soil766 TaxID=1736404 RepID=UPI0007098B0C|nr:styrene monooxygenase/indole monooxygenase family protein [Paenibacillus sp. Soil766]KRE99412.1 hypothetical protein ASG89_28030 [Paenibacillus sp. Soil766]